MRRSKKVMLGDIITSSIATKQLKLYGKRGGHKDSKLVDQVGVIFENDGIIYNCAFSIFDQGRGLNEYCITQLIIVPENNGYSTLHYRLLYTNSGVGLLTLASNAVQRLWKWSRSEQNPTGKHWQPNSGLLMTNDVSDTKPEGVVPCIALSKNDSYVMSTCGGKVSLFNMMTFKVMTTFMPPPLASTFLAFHPQDNNILAIGMEDSTIHIYKVRVDEV
ncbi:uncharacterized protein A4U43_C08F13140 [Asparagus officinalis]|nr:uncharacterized protein A4U43_C08F13140 [Asparagus officinalis]